MEGGVFRQVGWGDSRYCGFGARVDRGDATASGCIRGTVFGRSIDSEERSREGSRPRRWESSGLGIQCLPAERRCGLTARRAGLELQRLPFTPKSPDSRAVATPGIRLPRIPTLVIESHATEVTSAGDGLREDAVPWVFRYQSNMSGKYCMNAAKPNVSAAATTRIVGSSIEISQTTTAAPVVTRARSRMATTCRTIV